MLFITSFGLDLLIIILKFFYRLIAYEFCTQLFSVQWLLISIHAAFLIVLEYTIRRSIVHGWQFIVVRI
jgi:hypothetical protein